MKQKIVFAFICGLLLLWAVLPAGAAYSGTVRYGSFEEAGAEGVTPTGWTVYSNVPWYGEFTTSAEYAADGLFSLKTVAPSGSGMSQAILRDTMYWGYFDTSTQYELSVKILVPEDAEVKDALLRITLSDTDGRISDLYTPSTERVSGNTGGEWKKICVVFTPKKSFGAIQTVYIRCNSGVSGTVYWDDVRLYKLNADGTYADEVVSQEPVYEETSNILENGDFSSLKNGDKQAERWETSGTWGVESIVQKEADGEKNAVLLSGDGTPYITQTVKAAGGTKLTLSVRYKTNGNTGTPVIKFVYRDDGGRTIREFTTNIMPPTYGKWKRFTYDLTVDDGAAEISVLLRKYREPDVYYSTARLYVREKAPVLTISTDNNETFYYKDWESGTATAILNTDPTGKTVVFYLRDGENRVERKSKAAAETVSFSFSPGALTEKKPYVLTAELQDSGGNILGTAEKTVYVYARPAALSEDGVFTAGAEKVRPVFGYHVYTEDLPDAKTAGINVVQGMGDYETGTIGTFLDTCWYTYGIRVLVPLYSGNMLPAGHTVNRERTEVIVNAYKNHPGVFGWMVQDEPFLHNRNNPEEVNRQLIDSYKLIRDLDDVHPVYMTADIYSAEHYRDIGNACDIIAPDDYALGAGRELASVYGNMKAVDEAVRGRKPVYALLQTFAYAGGVQPTMNELGHMIYQSLLAGADAVGFYSFTETGWKFADTQLYTDLVRFNKEELPELYARLSRTDFTDAVTETQAVRKYGDGVYIGISLSASAITLTEAFPTDFALHFGNGTMTADGGNARVLLENGGRFIGSTALPAFGDTLQLSGTETISVQFTPDGRRLLPADAVLYTAVYASYNASWEMTDFAMGKTETTVTVPAGKTWKMAVMLMCPSDGRPIYIKEVITSQ